MGKTEERALLKRRYKTALELVQVLLEHGIYLHVQCPRCGSEGVLSILESNGYTYLVVRHPDKKTHTIPKSRAGDVLCKVERDLAHILTQLLEIYKSAGGAGFCTDAAGNDS